jgi:hypothetical protein
MNDKIDRIISDAIAITSMEIVQWTKEAAKRDSASNRAWDMLVIHTNWTDDLARIADTYHPSHGDPSFFTASCRAIANGDDEEGDIIDNVLHTIRDWGIPHQVAIPFRIAVKRLYRVRNMYERLLAFRDYANAKHASAERRIKELRELASRKGVAAA